MPLKSINPATEEVISEFEELTDGQIKEKIDLSQQEFLSWRETSFEQRKEKTLKLAEILKSNSRSIGEIMTKEMGKPITQAIAEVEKCAWLCEYYAENGEKFLSPEKVETDAGESYVRFDPIGIVLAVMPWNFPLWQVFRFIVPAAMAGNVGLLKHASNVQLSAQKIEEVMIEAGFPQGVFQNLAIGSSKVESIIRDDKVKAVTLTGSEGAGMAVARVAGEEIKKTVLELGGSDPFIILKDADLSVACEVAVTARLQNNGQSCIAAKRFVVVEDIADDFIRQFKEKFEALTIGDPLDEKTNVGPVVNEQSFNEISGQVKKAVESGATLVTGGERVGDKGYFYKPTILAGVTKDNPIYFEEVFGPVALVITVKDADEALEVANATSFGLGSSIWTQDLDLAKKMIPRIDAGAVFVNGMVKSDPRLPFGGEKRSGYGRELSPFGIREFVNVKSVWIK